MGNNFLIKIKKTYNWIKIMETPDVVVRGRLICYKFINTIHLNILVKILGNQ